MGIKNSYFTLFLDVYDHLGEVQSLQRPGVGHSPRVVQGNDILSILLKQKLLVMIKIVILSCFQMSMTILEMSRASDNKEKGIDPQESQGMTFWQFCCNTSC